MNVLPEGKHHMHLIVPTRLVGTIYELLEGTGVVVECKPYEVPTPKVKMSRYANGKRDKGISGADLAIKLVGQGINTRRSLAEEFQKQGFARKSATAVVSILKHEGRISVDNTGRIFLT
jgi:hypothetical protein